MVAEDLTAVAFVGLGAAIAYRWYRDRTRSQAMLAGALIALAATSVLGRLQNQDQPNIWLSALTLVVFVLSGFFVFLFRHELIPYSPRVLRVPSGWRGFALVGGLVGQVVFLHP